MPKPYRSTSPDMQFGEASSQTHPKPSTTPTTRKASLKEILTSILPDILKPSNTEQRGESITAPDIASNRPSLSDPDEPTLDQITKKAEFQKLAGGTDPTFKITQKLKSLLSDDDKAKDVPTGSTSKITQEPPQIPETVDVRHFSASSTAQSNAHAMASTPLIGNEGKLKQQHHLAAHLARSPHEPTTTEPSLFSQSADATGADWSAKDDTCTSLVARTEETKKTE